MSFNINPEYEKILPVLSIEEYEALKNSIKEDGLLYPIVVNAGGTILDGHNRFKICEELEITPEHVTKEFKDELQEKLFVITVNLKRRHLTGWQKAKMGIVLFSVKTEIAKEHLRLGHKSLFSNEKTLNTVAEVAKEIGLGETTFARAKKVIESAPAGIQDLVEGGELSISGAYNLVQKTEAANEMLASMSPDMKEEVEKQITPKLYTTELDLKEVDAIIRRAEGSPPVLKRIKLPYDKFVNDSEAIKFFMSNGGRFIGIEKVWVGEVDPDKYQEGE